MKKAGIRQLYSSDDAEPVGAVALQLSHQFQFPVDVAPHRDKAVVGPLREAMSVARPSPMAQRAATSSSGDGNRAMTQSSTLSYRFIIRMAFDNVDVFNSWKIPHRLVVSKNNLHLLN
jgi:hypothetical protein